MDILIRIKRLVAHGRYRLTYKASSELVADGLTPDDAAEAILNAQTIKKTLRSRAPHRPRGEKLYVIENFNYAGSLIYTKGRFSREAGEEFYYILISAKRSTLGDQA